MNYQSTKKGKCDFPFFLIFNDLLVIENGSTSSCCGNSELIRVSLKGSGSVLFASFTLDRGGSRLSPDIVRRRTQIGMCRSVIQCATNELTAYCPVTVCPCGFTNKLASHLVRSPLIHSYGYESAGDRTTCLARLFVSSMRLTPSGLTRYFVPDKISPLKSKSLMQYPG